MSSGLEYVLAWAPQGWEWLVILIVALLLFGRRLPEVARSLGKSLTEFKRGLNEAKNATDDVVDDVQRTKNDVVKQAKDATGINNSQSS